MSDSPHIADGEGAPFVVVNIEPDFCIVEGAVVPFEISQVLEAEKGDYAGTVRARGKKVLRKGSVIRGVRGDAGDGVVSGRSLGGGDCIVDEGDESILSEGQPTARHGHLCLMNRGGG